MQQIFIGDVQGCARELRELIRRARHRFGEDCEIWQVGDLVNKGPDNLAALELMREEVDRGRGHFVLGNHDLHLIRVLAGIVPLFPGDSLRDVQESAEAADWLAWLRGQPLVMPLYIDETPALMVHAAVHPRWTLPQCVERARAVEKRLSSPEQDDWVGLLETLPRRSGSVMAEAAAGSGAELRDD
ncbi:MAG: metallophosphoesterase, partial [Myxococcota bacterium]